jgi:hypothetical protein
MNQEVNKKHDFALHPMPVHLWTSYFLEKLRIVVFLRGRRRDYVTTARTVGVTADAALADNVRTVALPAVKLFILLWKRGILNLMLPPEQ